jgi:hypothetical protein
LYDPQNPVIDRIGLQGDAMTVAVCTDNDRINENIQLFNQALSDDSELIGERLRTLSAILKARPSWFESFQGICEPE